MDRPDNGTPQYFDDAPAGQEPPSDGSWRADEQGADDYDAAEDTEEVLGNDLAGYAFLREDDDREVRLYFRDAPVGELALAFRKAGGLLLSIAGERAVVAPLPIPASEPAQADAAVGSQPHRRRRHRSSDSEVDLEHRPARSRHTGELTLRYFFALEDIVYTLIITSSAGVIESISDIYPQAALSEQEVRARTSAIFK